MCIPLLMGNHHYSVILRKDVRLRATKETAWLSLVSVTHQPTASTGKGLSLIG